MTTLSDRIIELSGRGFSYREIQEELNCSKGTISYHLGVGQKSKSKSRSLQRKISNPLLYKYYAFISNYKREISRKFSESPRHRSSPSLCQEKVMEFQRSRSGTDKCDEPFTFEDLVAMYGSTTKCYITGDSIDLDDPKSYELDHIVPRALGGSNTLNNLGICTPEANRMKNKLTLEQLVELSYKVLKNFDALEEAE